jgi:hypothetical protein
LLTKASAALTVVRKIEQGKINLNLEKVNQILIMFGNVLAQKNVKDATSDS